MENTLARTCSWHDMNKSILDRNIKNMPAGSNLMENWIYLTPFQSFFVLRKFVWNWNGECWCGDKWVLIRRGDKDKIEAVLRTINLINSGIIELVIVSNVDTLALELCILFWNVLLFILETFHHIQTCLWESYFSLWMKVEYMPFNTLLGESYIGVEYLSVKCFEWAFIPRHSRILFFMIGTWSPPLHLAGLAFTTQMYLVNCSAQFCIWSAHTFSVFLFCIFCIFVLYLLMY